MERKRLPSSIRKFIRTEKARIRREFSGFEKQKELIDKLRQNFIKKDENKGNIQLIDSGGN